MALNETNYFNLSLFKEMNISATDIAHVPTGSLHLRIQFTCEHILMPIICCLGICGNALSLCVLTRREMSGATMSFLTALAVSDLLLLTIQIPVFFGLNADVASMSSFKLFYRFYMIIRLVCTIRKARLAIIGIFLLSFAFHFSKFFEYMPNPDLNSARLLLPSKLILTPAYDTYIHVANIVLAVILPVFLLVMADSFLIYFLANHRQRMLHHKTSASSNITSVDILHVSAIVVATVLVFIVCHSVGVFLALTIASKGRHWVFGRPWYIGLNHINTVMVMVNSSVNFVLYCAISRKFRKTLFEMCRRQMPFSEHGTGPRQETHRFSAKSERSSATTE